MKKKIAFVTVGDISSIATMKRALGMANPLLELGWEVSIIAMDCEENRKRIGMECSPSVKVIYYPETSVKEEVAYKTSFVREDKPDFVYFCSFGFRNRVSKSKLGYKPKMIVEHSELLSAINGLGVKHKLKAYVVEYWSIAFSDAFVCASKYLEKVYRKYSGRFLKGGMPVLYSPYAYNSDVINAPKIIERDLREKYAGIKVFVYMGTMTGNYGLFTMLAAVKELARKHKAFKLLLMGKGRHLVDAQKYVAENALEQYVGFLGYVPEAEISSYFALADAFISPLNNTVQDIARCPSKIYMYLPFRKPVLTCRIGEPAEIFGVNGFYFDNNDPSTLAVLMEELCGNEISNRDIDIEEHSWKKRSLDFDHWITQKIR